MPSSSGPRCFCAAFMRATSSRCLASVSSVAKIPEMLHIHCFTRVFHKPLNPVRQRMLAHTLLRSFTHLGQLRIAQDHGLPHRTQNRVFIPSGNQPPVFACADKL